MASIYPKDFFEKTNNKYQKGSCFVLMPFDQNYQDVYKTIKETLESEKLNIECNRADDFQQPHIIETILKGIKKAEYIIADLTESSPNVFYELGLAHSVKDIDKVIIITQDMEYVPFDIRQFRCIVYEQSIEGVKNLQEELQKTFNEVSKNSFRIKLKENRKIPFSKRLVGKENYLYEMEFECPFLGHDAIKLQIHFYKLSVDKSISQIETQFLYLSEHQPVANIDNIPWNVTLIKTNEGEATISIDKR